MPYRRHGDVEIERPSVEAGGDRDLIVPGVILWLASFALCAYKIVRSESIEGESALAALCVGALPYAAARASRKHKK